ncbi:hypothetical protein SIFV0010 [Sulfolobus islandicus filamentous virus]|uniref:Putative transmembrane protein 10 n=1 Tax=Sulfolobus islandicus filamentous virus (isolate Iceland/Hveragerdi) TaxID=654908 RepID=Y010_SIFVH|nr:hypothetical protein SIFV0010 [Sulfolobus islandicus filamentous virus]Q914M0.1 RecName: Full=Putative transmembrane protein 10 [Sulfolobus islandicus filamentous virus (isolate Hveragerdi)]AAL27721.1 conserved hypothetical protein [Sulfolobus islandicus filamentous virus]
MNNFSYFSTIFSIALMSSNAFAGNDTLLVGFCPCIEINTLTLFLSSLYAIKPSDSCSPSYTSNLLNLFCDFVNSSTHLSISVFSSSVLSCFTSCFVIYFYPFFVFDSASYCVFNSSSREGCTSVTIGWG